MAELRFETPGRVPYAEALEQMRKRVDGVRSGAAPETVFLLEHPPVVTLGRSARPENLRWPEADYAARGVELHRVNRGGDVTYHGPGQLVGYLVLDLETRGLADVDRYLRGMEQMLVDALAALGVPGATRPGYTGVFVAGSDPPRKIASIGVGLRGWVSSHGFALNVDLDPAAFECIVPCGLYDVEMTSVARETGAVVGPRAREAVTDALRGWLP